MNLANMIIGAISLIAILYLLWKIERIEKSNRYSNSENAKPTTQNPETDRTSQFINYIEKAPDDRKYYIARHCFNRLPASYELLSLLWKFHKETQSESMPTILQRDMIQDMSAAIATYRQACNIEDIERSNSISEELEQLSSEVLERLQSEGRELIKRQLFRLQELTGVLSDDPDNKEILRELEKLDNSLNKELIESIPELLADYRQTSDMLVSIFTQKDDDQEIIEKKEQAYNLKAIKNHKKALERLEADKSNIKHGTGLEKIVSLIGGWDNRYLLPSTISYTNTIYGTIFSKLKKEAQLSITELMVHEKKKSL